MRLDGLRCGCRLWIGIALLSGSVTSCLGGEDGSLPQQSIALCVLTAQAPFASRDRVAGEGVGVSQSPRTSAIYLIDVEKGRVQKIVNSGGRAEHPRFSPDGRWLYFQSNDRGPWDIYRCRPDGSARENLTDRHKLGRDSYGFEVSPRGDALTFAAHDGKIARVAIMQADGSGARIAAPELGHCYMASLSPSGQELALAHTAEDYRIVWVDLVSGRRRVLTGQMGQCFVPRFTPQGESVVFVRRDGDLYRADLKDDTVHRLTTGNGHYEFSLGPRDEHASTDRPDIAPDGARIAYVVSREGADSIWTIGLDGRDARQIVAPPGACGRVQWSPDGKQLSFVSFVAGNPQLFVVDVETKRQRQLTRLAGAAYDSHWMPTPEPSHGRAEASRSR